MDHSVARATFVRATIAPLSRNEREKECAASGVGRAVASMEFRAGARRRY